MTQRFIELCYVVIILMSRDNDTTNFSAERLVKVCRLDEISHVEEFTKRLTIVLASHEPRGLRFRVRPTSITVLRVGTLKRASESNIADVFGHWTEHRGNAKAYKLTTERERAIVKALEDGMSVEECKLCIDGCFLSTFHTEKGYVDLMHCLRPTNVERFIKLAKAKSREKKPGESGWVRDRMNKALRKQR